MTRFPASGGGSGPPYTYVMDGYPGDAEEGESLYHVTEDAAYVYTGSSWVKQTVTNHGQLAGVTANAHPRPVPSGAIMMWSGGASEIPAGYTLCDGTDGAPDLRNRFVVGSGGAYSDGQTGGQQSVTLSEAQMPSHDHGDGTLNTSTDGDHSHDYNTYTGGGPSDYNSENGPQDPTTNSTTTSGAHSHNVSGTTGSAGGDNSHENRPPYYALAFIMKT